MRIRVWNSFASNNSGSYTIVGFFREAVRAQAIAELLRPVLAEHSAWFEQRAAGEAPLHRFMREPGLRLDDEQVGLTDDWPHYGPPPEVVAIGQQVLVHCDYTVTMPRCLGELESGDPLEFLRGERRAVPGEHTVILWKPGPDRASTLKAIRAVTGTGLREALAVFDSLPAELLVGVNRHDAEQAVERLNSVGADAELLTPDDRRPR